jgi:hypothetical protein
MSLSSCADDDRPERADFVYGGRGNDRVRAGWSNDRFWGAAGRTSSKPAAGRIA